MRERMAELAELGIERWTTDGGGSTPCQPGTILRRVGAAFVDWASLLALTTASFRGVVWGALIPSGVVGSGDWYGGVSPTHRGPACTARRSHASRTSCSRPGLAARAS